MAWWGGGSYWPEYVPVAARIAKAKKEVEKLRKKGLEIQPVELSGRKIATSFWGQGWCDHMDSFHDYENRLPRGRAYVRNGSVVHMDITQGQVSALVAGTSTYKVEILIDTLSQNVWEHIKHKCAGQIASLVDLLKGTLSDGVMKAVASRDQGLFPGPKEIKMNCTCPDYASLCKHIAAVIYGIGARLDHRPELLFQLRGVEPTELATEGGVDAIVKKGKGTKRKLAKADLQEIFGIELVGTGEPEVAAPPAKAVSRKTTRPTTTDSPAKAKKTPKSGKNKKAVTSAADKTKKRAADQKTPVKVKSQPERRRKSEKETVAPKARRRVKPNTSKTKRKNSSQKPD